MLCYIMSCKAYRVPLLLVRLVMSLLLLRHIRVVSNLYSLAADFPPSSRPQMPLRAATPWARTSSSPVPFLSCSLPAPNLRQICPSTRSADEHSGCAEQAAACHSQTQAHLSVFPVSGRLRSREPVFPSAEGPLRADPARISCWTGAGLAYLPPTVSMRPVQRSTLARHLVTMGTPWTRVGDPGRASDVSFAMQAGTSSLM